MKPMSPWSSQQQQLDEGFPHGNDNEANGNSNEKDQSVVITIEEKEKEVSPDTSKVLSALPPAS